MYLANDSSLYTQNQIRFAKTQNKMNHSRAGLS